QSDSSIVANAGTQVGEHAFHAEAMQVGALGADFTYSADVTFTPTSEANLQFRISSAGRYGVSVRASGLRVYKQVRRGEVHNQNVSETDCLSWDLLCDAAHVCSRDAALAPQVSHHVVIEVRGSQITARVDQLPALQITDASLTTGHFGVYAIDTTGRQPWVT